jgi:DNA transposition AAA+ family ATPase
MTRQVPDEVTAGLRAELDQFFAARPDVTGPALASYTTLADATIRSFRTRENHGGAMVCAELRRVLDLVNAGEILQPGKSNGAVLLPDAAAGAGRAHRPRKEENFYRTETVRRIANVLDYCAENSAIGVATADFGVGKTEAVNDWRKINAGKIDSLVLEFDNFSARNVVDFVCVLGASFGVERTGGSTNGGRLFRELIAGLRKSPCLLIFDQCERTSIRVLDVIRQVHDRTKDVGVGVVMLSAPILVTRMLHSRSTDLGALTSRVGVWEALTGISKSEMSQIVKAEGFTDIDEAAFDLWYRSTAGSMRRLMRALDLLKAKHAGKRINEKTIAGVASHLWGMSL